MLRIIFFFIFFIFAVCNAHANINYIDVKKITEDKKLIADFQYIKTNLPYYKDWIMNWSYDVSKSELSARLKNIYEEFGKLNKNEELFLLLGDIAHYLYNLDASDETSNYNEIAADNYNKAIKAAPQDYRGFWFLGAHYLQIPGQYLLKSIDNFEAAQKLSNNKKTSQFWADYAQASILTAMPSHYLYASDKAASKEVLYKKDKLFVSLDKNREYTNKEIWNVSSRDEINYFISRPLGMRFELSKEEGAVYELQISDYKNNSGMFAIMPPKLKNKDGLDIGYTILVVAQTVDDKISLEDVVDNDPSIAEAENKKKINFSEKYEKIISYEITDKERYENIGGAHLYLITIERERPKYAGLAIETPNAPISEESAYFVFKPQPDRFAGKIIYTLILDSCEDIHAKSFEVFKDFFENKLILE
ncbi:MAG: hypothetical protein LBU09_02120 [Endomicrobium sp.]|jgi:hypothetical protein|nr:hypothetical protein [Endomicrobium sp.]